MSKVPRYDKSAHHGRGDRAPIEEWEVVNRPGEPTADVVLFEGWCVGFRNLGDEELEGKWLEAWENVQKQEHASSSTDTQVDRSRGRLGRQRLENIKTINQNLKEYDVLTK